ncbi:Alpha-1,2 mannosyltransferase KTR1 [Choanephora cucurbitarum]|uniref:Alpha-1,2 mannosyltransferase KTR1 n=1 Tax=Choanephora cucurbitarum TaxID=101091 RepID=A0A1C7NJ61_9FUNG|nr:Alpha-1,2 mannosyltransferase KTR1 [Choanephora cucurbitarum]
MMNKRRQSLGVQLILAIAVLCLIGYLFTPSHSSRKLSDHLLDQLGKTKDQHHPHFPPSSVYKRPSSSSPPVKAAFVILARNRELQGLRQSIRQLEDRFNRHFNYPYVFLNEEYFTDEFKQKTSDLTKAKTYYGKIDESMWGYPDFINQTHAAECRKDLENRKVIYGGSESYRHMCRFQSGFFFRHPLLDQFEYYWRVEPDVQYFCDIDYDVFQMMKDNDYKYGWTLSLTEYKETIPTLWDTTKKFMEQHPELIQRGEGSLLSWLTDDDFTNYNGCHFWSNFEIGSLEFFRSERYLKFFDFLDRQGGFFYERWGDAPVHSLAVAMMLKTSEVHFFNDIGYKHNPLMHCPIDPWLQKKCWCNDKDNFDWTDWSCATRYSKIQPDFAWSEAVFKNKTSAYRIHS